MMKIILAMGLAVIGFSTTGAAAPVEGARSDCEAALEQAAKAEEIPAGLLTAIARARQERVPASSYAVNVAGWRKVFEDRRAAKRGALRLHSVGDMRLGCGLMSWLGNMEAFGQFERMFDPAASARYFARFVRKTYEENDKSWTRAVKVVHKAGIWNRGRARSILCDISVQMADFNGKTRPRCP